MNGKYGLKCILSRLKYGVGYAKSGEIIVITAIDELKMHTSDREKHAGVCKIEGKKS